MIDQPEKRLRDVLPPRPEGDPQEIGARLAAEGKAEKDAVGFGWHRPADLYDLRRGAFGVLLPVYLDETGLSAEEAIRALDLLGSAVLYDVQAFEAEDPTAFGQYLELSRRVWTAKAIAQSLYVDGLGRVDPERPITVDAPPDLVEAVLAEAQEVAEEGQGAGFAWLVNGPDCVKEEMAQYESLTAPYELSREERKARAKAILVDRPDPVSYLTAAGWGAGLIGGDPGRAARTVLADLLRLAGKPVPESGNLSAARLLVPQAFMSLVDPAPKMARQRQRLEPYNDRTQTELAILEEVQESRSQMAEFSATELRVLIGALASYSRQADDGVSWPSSMRVDFRAFAEDCALDLSSGKNRDDLLAALQSVSQKEMRSTIIFREGKRRKAWLHKGPILKADVIVAAETPSAQAAVQEWMRSGVWKGDAPEEIVLQLQDVHAYLKGSMALDRAVLHRIDEAAKKVRGRIVDLDLQLFWKLFDIGPRQLPMRGPNGQPPTFIDRDQFLIECHGEERGAKERRAGRYRTRIEGPYLKSVEVLVEAGVIYSDWRQEYEARAGHRDVFEVQPWVTRDALPPAALDDAPKLLNAAPKKARKPRAKRGPK
jgi:hypothetical protein